ncbi:protein FAM188B2 isoform X2 [Sinocyclocheilus grahami]|uniref:protein FAM188B2 isoform X2 n=1 Tax=Sinocyclocheilus grahami TaxID=75366 RepID=UPI0007AD0801|nr:PREDICTED: protein FAM188B2-like isoform X2 [Sinocyclocheilus grahami]XP_016093176.1 PREDICTED: protein FAM188B2-like isoform X2 [Sinocyclocheilus grahami]XP_016093177.1 PREDICTED: protein FAM188B2-like isoform X2 [Sinocyclocheilus grahami]
MDTDVEASSEIDEILQQIVELGKWREIFNSHGLELPQGYVKRPSEKIKSEEDSDESSRPATSAHHIGAQNEQFTSPHSIPRTLTVSPSLGGQPLSPELAVSLRNILFGNTFHIFNYEWKKSFFKFREPFSDMPYALETERVGGACAIQMVVQAYIIKYLLFNRPINSECTMQSMVTVGEKEQRKALAAALTDILWTAGEEQTATVCLVASERCFTPNMDYKLDNFTERLQLFTFKKKDDVRSFICEHIQCFKEEGSHGIILFLYSLIFSRTIDRIRADFDCTTTHLLHVSLGNSVCRQALLNLLLTGRATPHVFNGTSLNDEQDEALAQPLHGVLTRSHIGYLLWNREQVHHAQLPLVGSMLKTPKLPIWVCNINGTYSVLFSPNRSLLSDWKMEHLFHLYFYNGQPTQLNTTMLTIDTHSHHWEAEKNDIQGDPEKKFPSVEMTIRTKWEGSVIDWNGTVPFF